MDYDALYDAILNKDKLKIHENLMFLNLKDSDMMNELKFFTRNLFKSEELDLESKKMFIIAGATGDTQIPVALILSASYFIEIKDDPKIITYIQEVYHNTYELLAADTEGLKLLFMESFFLCRNNLFAYLSILCKNKKLFKELQKHQTKIIDEALVFYEANKNEYLVYQPNIKKLTEIVSQ